jgi:hypothetical protein
VLKKFFNFLAYGNGKIEAVYELQAQGWATKMLKDKQIRREFDEKVAFDL